MHGYAFTKIQPPPVGLPSEIIVTNKLTMVHESCVKAAAADPSDENPNAAGTPFSIFLLDEIKSLWPSVRKPLISDSAPRYKA